MHFSCLEARKSYIANNESMACCTPMSLSAYLCGCDGPSTWTRVAFLNMSDPSQDCPSNWTLYSPPFQGCGRTPNMCTFTSIMYSSLSQTYVQPTLCCTVGKYACIIVYCAQTWWTKDVHSYWDSYQTWTLDNGLDYGLDHGLAFWTPNYLSRSLPACLHITDQPLYQWCRESASIKRTVRKDTH